MGKRNSPSVKIDGEVKGPVHVETHDHSISFGPNAHHNTITTTNICGNTAAPEETPDWPLLMDELRTLVAQIQAPDSRKLTNAVDDLGEEVAKPQPEPAEVGDALDRVLRYATKAEDFASRAETLMPRLKAAAQWLGEHGAALLGYFT